MYDDVSILKRKYLKEDKRMSNDDYYYQAKELIGKYEMVEDEEIYQDGELSEKQAIENAIDHIFYIGDWVIMREVEDE